VVNHPLPGVGAVAFPLLLGAAAAASLRPPVAAAAAFPHLQEVEVGAFPLHLGVEVGGRRLLLGARAAAEKLVEGAWMAFCCGILLVVEASCARSSPLEQSISTFSFAWRAWLPSAPAATSALA